MKFSIIISDPPWEFSDRLTMSKVKRGAAAHYNTLSIDELCELKVKDICDPDGTVLCLWVIGSMLEDGLRVMKSWGFSQKQILVWNKIKQEPLQSLKKAIKSSNATTQSSIDKEIDQFSLNSTLSFGMGHLWRQCHEICLVGINNTKIYKKLKNKSQRSVFFAANEKHSTKPNALHESLDLMFPDTSDYKLNRLEMFARRQYPGWYSIGNEILVNGVAEDIRDSLARLKAQNELSSIVT